MTDHSSATTQMETSRPPVSAKERCAKAGCGALKHVGHPCHDWDCPQRWVKAEDFQALEKERDTCKSNADHFLSLIKRAMEWGVNGAKGYDAHQACSLGDEMAAVLCVRAEDHSSKKVAAGSRNATDGSERIFAFPMGAEVAVKLAGRSYVGRVVSRLESHTGGINYAVYANYHHAKGSEWFMENELSWHMRGKNIAICQLCGKQIDETDDPSVCPHCASKTQADAPTGRVE